MAADKPVAAQDEPAGQAVHDVALPKENCPELQATGAADTEAQDDPAGQAVHAEEPINAYVPAALQAEHADSPPVAAMVPAAQLVHTDDPVPEEYEPLGQT